MKKIMLTLTIFVLAASGCGASQGVTAESQPTESELVQSTEPDTQPDPDTEENKVVLNETESTPETEEEPLVERYGQEYMSKVYELMSQKNFDGMKELAMSAEAKTITADMPEDALIYQPDASSENISGTAAGLYRYHGKDGKGNGYYYYFGDYIDGARNGAGYTFSSREDGHESYEGSWESDVPQGEFIKNETGIYNGEPYEAVTKGTMKDGLEDGDFEQTINAMNLSFQMNWHSEEGVAPDIYDELEDWEKQALGSIREDGYTLYGLAVAGDGQNYYLWWGSYDPNNEKLGIYEYTFE